MTEIALRHGHLLFVGVACHHSVCCQNANNNLPYPLIVVYRYPLKEDLFGF